MISKSVKQSSIFTEFSDEEINYHFDMKEKAVKPHVDSFYYSVFVEGDSNDCSENMQAMLDRLKGLKEQKASNYSQHVEYLGMSVENKRFATYEYCLEENEMFHIFIASYLPNVNTPRIVVQLRTRSLVLNGVCQSICKSYRRVETLLGEYGLVIERTQENRVDYAWHTNLIQSPYKFFSDDLLLEKLCSRLRLYQKVGNIGRTIDIDYISFGNRKSNDVFVRCYNKTREVVEKNYKSFFLEKWLTDGLINRYDYFVYQVAYKLRSYVIGVLIGRIDWYLLNGKDPEIKAELAKVKKSCYINSDNSEHLKEVVDRYLPPVTLIMNVEFETKRKFYRSLDKWISHFGLAVKNKHGLSEFLPEELFPIHRLFLIYSLRSEFCKYLTEETLCFMDNKGTKEAKMSNWWKRIHGATMEDYAPAVIDLWRTQERLTDRKKACHSFYGALATVSIITSGDVENVSDFQEDLSDVLCLLNDNHFYGFSSDPETGEVIDVSLPEYLPVRKRRQRQWKPILNKQKQK